jgi:hypothetical protein
MKESGQKDALLLPTYRQTAYALHLTQTGKKACRSRQVIDRSSGNEPGPVAHLFLKANRLL